MLGQSTPVKVNRVSNLRSRFFVTSFSTAGLIILHLHRKITCALISKRRPDLANYLSQCFLETQSLSNLAFLSLFNSWQMSNRAR